MSRTIWTRWLPAVVAPAVVVAVAVAVPLTADASPNLPDKTPQQLLELVAASAGTAFSGTVEQTSDLGLPELPSSGQFSDESDALELATGDHEVRVYSDGDDSVRLQVLDQLGERDVVRNGADVWLYNSDGNEATHATLPDQATATPDSIPTPDSLAQQFLADLDPSTTVAVDDTATVAGRDAYVLSLTPTSGDTLVGSVELSVDAETGLPLGVAVTARGEDDPAFSVAFDSIDFTAPDDSLFDFAPPAGATVEEQTVPSGTGAHHRTYDGPVPTVTGTGWDSVVEIATSGAALPASGDAAGLLDSLTTQVDGGRAIQTALVSVLITDDGRVLAGAVPVERLQAVAAS